MKQILILTTLFLFNASFSQTIIKGTVTDEKGKAIIGANIFLKDTYDGTSSEVDGSFSFETYEEGTQVLSVSYIGYEPMEQPIELNNGELNFNLKIEEEANELNTVTISAGAFEASDEKKAVILNSIDIVTTAGANADIASALNTLPGTQTVGEEGKLFVRGGAAYETRTFIDGLYVQNPYSSSVPDVPARGRFSPFLFSGMMFSTGGYSAEYGQALSSALILNSQDLAPENSTGISLMTVGLDASHTHRWENTSLAVTGNYINLGPYTALAPQNVEWDKPFQGAGGQMIFRHKTSETGIFKIHSDYNKGWFALQYPDFTDVTKRTRLDLKNDNFYVNSSFKEIIGEKWSLFVGGAYTYNNDDIEELFSVKTAQQSAQGKLTLTNNLNDNLKIKFGGEYLWSDFDENFISADSETFYTNLRDNYGAAFVETDIYLSRKFVTRVGGRLEYSDILQNWNLAPRLSLAYKNSDHAQFSFAYGQFYQTPEYEFLRYNTDVDFERADHYMLNYQLIKNNRTFRIEGFLKEYKGLVKYDQETPWLSNNEGDGYARGIDLFYRDKAGMISKGDFWISYSFIDTKRNWREFPMEAHPTFASKHNLSVVYKHWLPKITSSMGFTYTYASPRPYNDPNTDGFNDERTTAFNDLSFNFTYLTNLFGHFTVVHLSATNILGFENTFGYRFSNVPDANGNFSSTPIQQQAKRFFFVGCFISIGQKYSTDNGVTSN